MLGLLILLAEGLAIAWLACVGYTVWMLTHPVRRTFASALARGKPADPGQLLPAVKWEEWRFKSDGIEFPVWDIAGGSAAGPVLLMTHGWGDSRLGALSRVPSLLPHCSRLIAWDMRGHGEAPGTSTLGTAEPDDLATLVARLGSERPIVAYGWSLGAGVSIVAATRVGLAGVIAEAPYRLAPTPARNVLRIRQLPYRLNVGPAFWLLGLWFGVGRKWIGFDRAEHAARVVCPMLVLHGSDDSVCPVGDGREIAARAPRAGLVEVPGGGHHTLWSDEGSRTRCETAVIAFLNSLPDRVRLQLSGTEAE